jgi:hypothetical protein
MRRDRIVMAQARQVENSDCRRFGQVGITREVYLFGEVGPKDEFRISHSKYWYPTVINAGRSADISIQPGDEKNEPLFHRGLVMQLHSHIHTTLFADTPLPAPCL